MRAIDTIWVTSLMGLLYLPTRGQENTGKYANHISVRIIMRDNGKE